MSLVVAGRVNMDPEITAVTDASEDGPCDSGGMWSPTSINLLPSPESRLQTAGTPVACPGPNVQPPMTFDREVPGPAHKAATALA